MNRRLPAIFVGDAPGLDFLNSVATPLDAPLDWIDDGAGLAGWLVEAGLVPAATLEDIRAHSRPGALDQVAEQARTLREWFRGFVRQHKGRPLKAKDLVELVPLTRLLEREVSFRRIVPRPARGGLPFQLQAVRRWRGPDSLLLPIADALAQLVCTEDFSRVKACEGPSCTLLFVDRTRAGRRRWCSMALCGNRAKQAAHRQRQRAARD